MQYYVIFHDHLLYYDLLKFHIWEAREVVESFT